MAGIFCSIARKEAKKKSNIDLLAAVRLDVSSRRRLSCLTYNSFHAGNLSPNRLNGLPAASKVRNRLTPGEY